MTFSVTIFFYLLVGLPVGVALWLSDAATRKGRLFRSLTAPLFWPLYIPLFALPTISPQSAINAEHKVRSSDDMSTMIAKVETELDTALRSLDGWAENVLADEQNRIRELRVAWRHQADAIRQLDRLLVESSIPTDVGSLNPASGPAADPSQEEDQSGPSAIVPHEQSRNQNIQKLKRVRRQLHEDLMATLAWVRELVTMIHLAKYTGAPASRAVELVQQIAAAVEGLSKVNQSAA